MGTDPPSILVSNVDDLWSKQRYLNSIITEIVPWAFEPIEVLNIDHFLLLVPIAVRLPKEHDIGEDHEVDGEGAEGAQPSLEDLLASVVHSDWMAKDVLGQ